MMDSNVNKTSHNISESKTTCFGIEESIDST